MLASHARLAAFFVPLLAAACAAPTPAPVAQQAAPRTASWQFAETPERCTLRAGFPEDDDNPTTLTLAAERGGGMSFVFSNTAHPLAPRPPGVAAALHFIGNGHDGWTIPAAIEAPRVVDTELPLNGATLAEAQALFGGGTLIATGSVRSLPPLSLRPAESEGAAFLACAQRLAGP